jgi:hypothetical protein
MNLEYPILLGIKEEIKDDKGHMKGLRNQLSKELFLSQDRKM